MGLMLKKLGSNKKVYGYDSFSGFPGNIYDPKDDFDKFKEMHSQGRITDDHYKDVQSNIYLRNLLFSGDITPESISTSGNSLQHHVIWWKKKLKFLGWTILFLLMVHLIKPWSMARHLPK